MVVISFERSPRIFAEGALLIEEGKPPGSLFVLESGEVEVLRHGVVVASIADAGAIIGEMSVLLDTPHSSSVRARTTVMAYAVDNAREALRQHPELTFKVAQILARRLNATTDFLVASQERLEAVGGIEFVEKVYELVGRTR
jgi:CRP-like cAMP-binding protein